MLKIRVWTYGLGAVVLAYAGFQFRREFSDIDSQVINKFKEEIRESAREGKLSAEPALTFSEKKTEPYTKENCLPILMPLYGYENGSGDYNDLALMAGKYFDEFTPEEQVRLKPYLLPTDPGVFHVSIGNSFKKTSAVSISSSRRRWPIYLWI